jgi:serine phosphatase RsbU (regulator of sigma subunit)
VGGDYYGFIPLHEAHETRGEPVLRWAIAVGDVVGKGLPAALLTAQLSAEIRLFLQGETDPARVIEHAVKGMLPHNRLGDEMMKKLKVYVGATHPHQAQTGAASVKAEPAEGK